MPEDDESELDRLRLMVGTEIVRVIQAMIAADKLAGKHKYGAILEITTPDGPASMYVTMSPELGAALETVISQKAARLLDIDRFASRKSPRNN